ncbi:MAG: RNA methyltransferase [Candidatus Liptonbacteria bacterium]|nr:RNA methyltransferase [Candidatus Liptonbacteria bacterium]
MRIVVILHNIRSLHNVGSIFRTSDGAGVEKIYLSGITPTPLDRFGHYIKEVEKVALGAERSMPWEKISSTASLLLRLKKEGWKILAIEQAKNSLLYTKKPKSKKIAVVLGAEVKGLPPSILKAADTILEIPMLGKKESLNVSVTAGIILFSLRYN